MSNDELREHIKAIRLIRTSAQTRKKNLKAAQSRPAKHIDIDSLLS